MYPSLSIIDDAELRRQGLLADAVLRRQPEGASLMQGLVNASYGIAMGQRPTVTEAAVMRRPSRIDEPSSERPQADPAGAHQARHVLRALAAAIASIRRPRALMRPDPR